MPYLQCLQCLLYLTRESNKNARLLLYLLGECSKKNAICFTDLEGRKGGGGGREIYQLWYVQRNGAARPINLTRSARRWGGSPTLRSVVRTFWQPQGETFGMLQSGTSKITPERETRPDALLKASTRKKLQS